MNTPKTVIDQLRELIALECKAAALDEQGIRIGKALAQETSEARALIPTSILGHHDRLRIRGKKSVAPVRNGVCGACHLKLPISHVVSLNPREDLEVCDNCGVFLYIDPVQEPVAAKPMPGSRLRTGKPVKSPSHKAKILSSVDEHLSLNPE